MRRGGGGEAVSFGDDRSSLRRSRGEVAARSVDGGAMARGRWPLHRSLRERSPSPWLRHREEFGGGPPPHASRREELVYRFAVGFVLEARLDRLPVGGAGRARERGGKDRLAAGGVGAGDDEARHAAAMASASASAISSMLASSTLSVIAIRRRAVPSATVGGRMPRMSKPASRRLAAMRIVRSVSPMITGRICEIGRESRRERGLR